VMKKIFCLGTIQLKTEMALLIITFTRNNSYYVLNLLKAKKMLAFYCVLPNIYLNVKYICECVFVRNGLYTHRTVKYCFILLTADVYLLSCVNVLVRKVFFQPQNKALFWPRKALIFTHVVFDTKMLLRSENENLYFFQPWAYA